MQTELWLRRGACADPTSAAALQAFEYILHPGHSYTGTSFSAAFMICWHGSNPDAAHGSSSDGMPRAWAQGGRAAHKYPSQRDFVCEFIFRTYYREDVHTVQLMR